MTQFHRFTATLSAALALLAPALASAEAPCYELIRIAVDRNGTPQQTEIRCTLTPGYATRITKIQGQEVRQNVAFDTNEQAVQDLVEQACAIDRLDLNQAVSYTEWFVRVNPQAAPKLIRQNLQYADGSSKIVQDESDAGRRLARFLGDTCLATFGTLP
jgi:hypothetical protein